MNSQPKFLPVWSLLVILLLSNGVQAQDRPSWEPDYLVKTWGADEGLALATVTDVAQTPEGYLWVGTMLNGLLRFDGVRFVGYGSMTVPEFRSMGIRHLMVDNTGRLWISTYGNTLLLWEPSGLKLVWSTTEADRTDRLLWSASERVLFVSVNGKLIEGQAKNGAWQWQLIQLRGANSKTQFAADASGTVWYRRSNTEVGTWQGGVEKVVALAGMEGQQIKTLVADNLGNIWVGTDAALARWQDGHFATLNPTNGEAQLNVKRIIPSDSSGSLWVEANGRMWRLVGRRRVAESEEWPRDPKLVSSLRFLCGDSRGGLWATAGLARNAGLIHVRPDGELDRFTTHNGLPSDTIQKAYPDSNGNVWAIYGRGGLVQLHPQTFLAIGEKRGLKDSLITSVSEDTQGALWIGAYGGVARWLNGQVTNFIPMNDFPRVQTVAADAQGRVWLGVAGGGLVVYEDGHFRTVAKANQFPSDIRLLLPARDGRLWIGTLETIFTFADGKLAKVQQSAASQEHLSSLAEADDGTIYVGTHGGFLKRWNGKKFEKFSPPGNEKLGRFLALCPAADGGLWIGSLWGGLLRWQDGQFRRYTTKDGLPSDSIVQIQTDAQGNLWLGTDMGIVRVAEANLRRFDRGEIKVLPFGIYDRNDGLQTIGSAIQFQPNSWRGRDGTLWFAMENSVAGVHPEQVQVNVIAPTVVIEEIQANEKSVWPSQPAMVLYSTAQADHPPTTVKNILKVGPGKSDLAFRYTGLSLESPAKVRFKYKLEGLDEDWVDAGIERRAVYRQVPPGDYRFQVMACNRDGVWNGHPVGIDIRVEPHYYQTGWFRGGIMLLAMAGLVFGVWIFARRRLHLRLERLERQQEMQRERLRIARDLHDDLGASLTEVGLISSLAQRASQPPTRVQNQLQQISGKVREMVTSLDEIVWSLNPKHESLAALSQYFSEYVQQFLQTTSLKCQIDVAESLPAYSLNSEQRQNLLLAYKEALNNVVRHARATEVRIGISVADDALVVSVMDDGSGIEAKPESSTADGLPNMSRRMEKLGGKCEIQSASGKGTEVRLIFPLGRPRKT